MTLAQLKEAEDEFDDEDMRAIETYRYSDSLGNLWVLEWTSIVTIKQWKRSILSTEWIKKRTKLIFSKL